jgi:ribonuclease III
VAGDDPLGAPVRHDPLSAAPPTDPSEALALLLGHRFADAGLLRQALVHPSALPARAGERGSRRSSVREYERLEFLGDRVLGLVVSHMLYSAFPGESEGALAKRLGALVRRETVARVADTVGLGSHLVLSRGEAESGGRSSVSVLADAFEAVIGALYLDAGLPVADAFVRRHWQPLLEEDAHPPQDPKTALQEWAQGAGLPLPRYALVASEGPPHLPIFCIEVHVGELAPARGTGRSKQVAQQAAAAAMLEQIGATTLRHRGTERKEELSSQRKRGSKPTDRVDADMDGLRGDDNS